MDSESQNQREHNLRNLRKWVQHIPWVLVLIVLFLPEIEEHMEGQRYYVAFGVIWASVIVWWYRRVGRWFSRTGRDLGRDPLFLLAMGIATLITSIPLYAVIQAVTHRPYWSEALAFSWVHAVAAFVVAAVLCVSSGLFYLVITFYRRGESILLESSKPSPFWHVKLIVIAVFSSILLVVIFAGLGASILNTSH